MGNYRCLNMKIIKLVLSDYDRYTFENETLTKDIRNLVCDVSPI